MSETADFDRLEAEQAEEDRWRWGKPPDLTTPGPPPREATMLRRVDQHGLIYPGLVHSLVGEPESGKSWVALHLAAETAKDNRSALYLDFEDDESSFRNRLDLFDLDRWERECLIYQAADVGWWDAPEVLLEEYPDPGVVIIDGVSEAMSLLKWDPLGTEDAVKWLLWVRRWTRQGHAVLTVDHVVKDKQAQGRWALGSQHKMAGVSVTYVAEPRGLLRRGSEGVVNLRCAKDRAGDVRRHGGNAVGKDRLQEVGSLVFGGEVPPYVSNPETSDDDEWGTTIDPKMEKARGRVLSYLKTNPPEEDTTGDHMEKLWKGIVARDAVRAAIVQLLAEGKIGYKEGPRGAHYHFAL